MDMQDFRNVLTRLPADQREALILVGAAGFSYEEAADVCGCAVGTIKSRVNRARNRLADMLGLSESDVAPEDSPTAPIGIPRTA
jgi:RNA polymerase sigma-70 factor (ECF subfamily)